MEVDVRVTFRESLQLLSAKLYKQAASSSRGNFILCPLSSQLVLAFVLNGAQNQTAQQLAHAMSLPLDVPKVNQIVSEILPIIQSGRTYTLKSVSNIFVSKDVTIASGFAKTASDIFKSTVQLVDFSKIEESVNQINTWAANNSENGIKNLLTAQDIEIGSSAILLSAIHFQATWSKKFRKDETTEKPFYTSPSKTTLVDMMEQTNTFQYLDQCNAQFLKMSYLGANMSMVVALPKEHDGLSELEDQINNVLNFQSFETTKLHVLFPKFSLNTKIKLKPLLQKLGVTDLFTPFADLTRMSDRPLFVSDVLQKNYIEVNENGTIAASATAAKMGKTSSYNPEDPIEFVADHPFLYYILSPVGIMFIGRYFGTQ